MDETTVSDEASQLRAELASLRDKFEVFQKVHHWDGGDSLSCLACGVQMEYLRQRKQYDADTALRNNDE
jgi:hypothetical protein